MIMGYHGSLSCHLGSFSRTHQNLNHHSLSSSSKSSLHSSYFHLWIWSLHVRVPQFWSLEEWTNCMSPQEPLQSWQAKNTSSWVISPFCQQVRIASGHQTRQWKNIVSIFSPYFTILSHDLAMFYPWMADWISLRSWSILLHPHPSLPAMCPWGFFMCRDISCDILWCSKYFKIPMDQKMGHLPSPDITGSFQRFFLLRSTLSAGDSGLIQAMTQRRYRTLSKWFEITH